MMMNNRPGLIFVFASVLLLAGISGHSQDTTKKTQFKTTQQVKRPAVKTYVPPPIKPAVQVPAQQPPAIAQQLPLPVPEVIDHTLKGRYNAVIKSLYHYQQQVFIDYSKSVMDSLNTEKRKFRDAQSRLQIQNKTITDLQGNVTTKDQTLTEAQARVNEVNLLGIPMPKTTYNIIMWGLVLILGISLITVIYLSASNRNEAAYRIKLYEDLDEEFKAYKVKANEKEKKLARELQTERNKVDELLGNQ